MAMLAVAGVTPIDISVFTGDRPDRELAQPVTTSTSTSEKVKQSD
jgi:hypothetical protein